MPFDAESSDEATPVVGVVGESVGVAADLFGEHVHVLDAAVGGATGGVVGEDLFGPSADGAGEAAQFGDIGVGAVDVEGDESAPGVGLVSGLVYVSEELLGHPGSADLPVGITSLEEGAHPLEPIFGEPLVGGQQHPSDPIQRIGPAAPVPDGLVLDPAPDLVDGPVGEPDGMPMIDDQGGVAEVILQRFAVPGSRVECCHTDLGAPVVATASKPTGEDIARTTLNDVEEPVPV